MLLLWLLRVSSEDKHLLILSFIVQDMIVPLLTRETNSARVVDLYSAVQLTEIAHFR